MNGKSRIREPRLSRRTGATSEVEERLRTLFHRRKDVVIDTAGTSVSPTLLLEPFRHATKGSSHLHGVLLTDRPEELERESRQAPFDTAVLGLSGNPRSERAQVGRDPDIVVATPERVIDHLRRDNLDVTHVKTVVIEEASEDRAGYFTDIQYILSKIRKHPHTLLFAANGVPPNEISILKRPVSLRLIKEEESTMGTNDYIDNGDELKKRIKDILHDIHNEEDPLELNDYKRFFKKHVPIFRRAYFTAYLLKQLDEKGSIGGRRSSRRGGRNGGRDSRESRDTRDNGRENNKQNGEMTSVFIGIGKNRRVFPRDLVALFTEVEGITGDDIGQIKILDNYSFMEINPEQAQKAIDAVNGREFRGRKLNVNYAKRKD